MNTTLDYFKMLRESRALEGSSSGPRLKVAVVSDASTEHLAPLLRVLFARAGFACELYCAPFDGAEIALRDERSDLHRFEPDAILLCPSTNALRAKYHEASGDRSDFGATAASVVVAQWDAARARSPRALIVQATFVLPYERELGSFGLSTPGSLCGSVLDANARIIDAARARQSVLLCDLDGVASWVGKRSFFDDRLWTMAKTFSSLEHLPRVAKALVDVVLAAQGRVIECIVVGLDGTLWGGTLGDDGIEGVQIGHAGEGEAYRRFQLWLRELARRGIALVVSSNVEREAALRVFREHPEMALRERDIALFAASGGSTVDAIKHARDMLGIEERAMVFLDGRPYERNLVRRYLSNLVVPELPEDPSDFVLALSELNLFESTHDRSVSAHAIASDATSPAKMPTDVGEYLESLAMKITIARFDSFQVPRIVHLLHHGNQFNLTTRRETEAECAALIDAVDVLPIYVTLSDRYGDHGLVSVVIGRFERARLEIETWVMTCRVLGRGIEERVMDRVVAAAKERGIPAIVGHYIRTAKNAMVEEHYARFGFERSEVDAETGTTTWVLQVAAYQGEVAQ